MLDRSLARGFAPTLFEKLYDDAPRLSTESTPLRRLNVEQLKESVARDLEALLNSRRGPDDALEDYPLARQSILGFGILDFVGMSLSNPADCHRICRTIEETIHHHEPRLKQVRVFLEADEGSTNSLLFSISALLVVYPAQEPVSFDAMLQPTIQQYSVVQARRIRG